MTPEENYFVSDGLRLFYRLFPGRPENGRIVILHGHGEHSGRYEKVARILAPLNAPVAVFDFRGCGRSEGREVYVDSLDDYFRDVSSFFDWLDRRLPSARTVLLGHSLGGLAAVHWALAHPGRLHGMILSSPCLGLRLPGWLEAFNGLLDCVIPRFVYRNPVYPPYLTHSEEERERYRQDPLIKRKISVRLLSEMVRYTRNLADRSEIRFDFPVHILMAGLEKVVDSGATRSFFDKLAVPQKSLRVFDDFYHEIFNERGQERVFEALQQSLLSVGISGGSAENPAP